MDDNQGRLTPVVGERDAWPAAEASWTCDRCGTVASTLTLVPPFGTDPNRPRRGEPGWLPGQDEAFADAIRLAIDGPIHGSFVFTSEMNVDIGAIEAGIRAKDPEALWELDKEYVPFWCRLCLRAYCKSCWVIWVDYDETFYDCTWGRCPEGHQRILDD